MVGFAAWAVGGWAVGASISGVASAGGADVPNTLARIVEDMTRPHEAAPAGVPASYSWAKGPRVGMGDQPGTWRAFVPWGQLYEAAGGNPARNTRVEIRRLSGWILSRRTDRWTRVSTSEGAGMEGAAYAADFGDDRNRPADARAAGDGVVVGAGDGWNYHFWPRRGRVAIDPGDIGGVFVTAEARLVPADPAGPDDRAQARFVLSVGADWWSTLDAQWDHFRTNNDVGIGRFRLVRPEWAPFNMTTLDAERLRRNPPPLDGGIPATTPKS